MGGPDGSGKWAEMEIPMEIQMEIEPEPDPEPERREMPPCCLRQLNDKRNRRCQFARNA